jgi:hypothetical protein
MGADAITTINFGAFPGSEEAVVVITGQTSIVAGSRVEAWLIPNPTADHSEDEHLVDAPRILAGTIVAGVGFSIYGFIPIADRYNYSLADSNFRELRRPDDRLYGLYTVGWVWN